MIRNRPNAPSNSCSLHVNQPSASAAMFLGLGHVTRSASALSPVPTRANASHTSRAACACCSISRRFERPLGSYHPSLRHDINRKSEASRGLAIRWATTCHDMSISGRLERIHLTAKRCLREDHHGFRMLSLYTDRSYRTRQKDSDAPPKPYTDKISASNFAHPQSASSLINVHFRAFGVFACFSRILASSR